MNGKPSYRLAIVDLDDTLLGHDKQISAANLLGLARLRAAGIEIVIASGRHHDNIVSFEEKTGCVGWTISSAGAMVRHAATGEILHELTLPSELALEIYRRGRELDLSVIGYHRTGIYIERETEWTRLDARRSGQAPQMGDLQALAREGLQKLMWTAERSRIDALHPGVLRGYRDRLYIVHTESELIEFLSPEANKARGAQAVSQRLGIAREETVAFGDGNNDVPVLEWAGMSVAMDHGRESARRAAHRVTPPGPHEEAFSRAVEIVLNPA
jgi:Cof subfamily protein (haloacid dehalogenase superfamily)